MLLLAPPPKLLLLPPPRIRRGVRVVWSAAGRKHITHYYNRALPRDGVFTVEEVIEIGKMISVRLRELKSPTELKNLEPAPVARC